MGSRRERPNVYWEHALCTFNDRRALFLWAEFIIQYEENHWEPEKWKELLRVAGSQLSAPLTLYCHINYQFRVVAVNAVGRSHPSIPSERYRTPPCGRATVLHCLWYWKITIFKLSLVHLANVSSLCKNLPLENGTDVHKSFINFNALLSERCLRLSTNGDAVTCDARRQR